MTLLHRFLILTSLLTATIHSASADTITLDNGDRLSGTITKMEGGKLFFSSTYAGDLEIPWEAVVELATDNPIVAELSNEQLVSGAARTGRTGQLDIETGATSESVVIAVTDIVAINPPTPEELAAYDFGGFANVGISATSGNSDTQTYNLAAEFTAENQSNRFKLGGNFNRGEEDGETIIDNWTLYGTYDRFFGPKWFWNNSITLQQNDLQELDLRTAIGSGVGYQFFNSDELSLAATFGLAYLRENFAIAPTDETIAARWSIDYQHLWLPWLTFFHYDEGLVSIEDPDDFVITSRTGWRFPIVENLTGSLQVNFNYDNSPSPGTESEDFIYLVNLGYTWD